MDSERMTTDAGPPAASVAESGKGLGHGIVHRGRRQAVLARQRPAARLIGAVGRSSIGFGLAVGRSRSIRPVVRRADLNTPALRPPPGFWNELHAPDAVEETVAEPVRNDTTAASTAPPTVRRRHQPPQRVARVAASPTVRADTRASWTDQVIERSAVGYVRPTSQTFTPAPKPADDDFVSSGDARLDDLRLLLASKQGGSSGTTQPSGGSSRPASSTPPADGASAASVQRSDDASNRSEAGRPAGESADDVDGVTSGGVRGDTFAGRSTGPGRLARSVIPESAIAGTALSAGRATQRRGAGAGAPGVPTVPTPEANVVRRQQAPQRSAAAQRLDDLRAALESKGLMPGSSDVAAEPASALPSDAEAPSPAGATRRREEASPRRGSASPQRDSIVRRSARPSVDDGGSSRPTPRSDRTVAPNDPRAGAHDGGRPDGGNVPPTASLRGSAGKTDRSIPADDVVAADGASIVNRQSVQRSETTGRLPVAATALLDRPLGGGDLISETSAGFPSVARTAATARLDVVRRIQRLADTRRRLLDEPDEAPSTGPAELVEAPPADTTTMQRRAAHAPAAADPVSSTTTAFDVGEQVEPDDEGVHAPAASVVRLPGIPGSVAPLRRRLSIPRALSARHRPENPMSVDGANRLVRSPGTDSSSMPLAPTTARRVPSATVRRQTVSWRNPDATSASVEPTSTVASADSSSGSVSVDHPPVRADGAPAAALIRRSVDDRWEHGTVSSRPAAVAADLPATRPPDEPVESAAGTFAAESSVARVPVRSTSGEPPRPSARSLSTVRRSLVAAGPGALVEALRRSTRPDAPVQRRADGDLDRTRSSASSDPSPAMRTSRPTGAPESVAEVAPVQRSVAGAEDATSPTAAADQPPVNDVAKTFMSELAHTVRRRPAPLPVSFQPMAEAITGGRARNVMLSTDSVSRRALRKVGKVAATTDNVIHLADTPTPGARMNEVIAHELTHIANPSPVARFFDDAHDSPEERQAEQVARVMASSPIAPAAAATAAPSMRAALTRPDRPAPTAPGGDDVIRRSAASAPNSTGAVPMSASNSGMSAASLAASITGNRSGAPQVQRFADPGSDPAGPTAIRPSDPVQNAAPSSDPGPSASGQGGHELGARLRDSSGASEWFSEELERNFDWLVTALEDRMIVEFERRGGRLWDGL